MKPVRWGMRTVLMAGASAFAIGAGGCATQGMSPETARAIIQEFHAAGCGGDFGLNANIGLGQLGGGASLNLDINAECPVGDIPPGAPLTPLSELR